MDEDAGMVHPGRQPAWWTRPPVLLLTGVGVLIVVLAVLFLADMAQRQQLGPEDAAALETPAAAAVDAPGSTTSAASAGPSSMTATSASSDRSRSLSTTTVASTPTSTSTSPVSATTATSPDPSTTTATSRSSTTVSTTPTPTSTAPTARPAALTAPALTQGAFTARAGSTFRAVFTVTNTGAGDSGPRTITVSAPPGVTIADVGIALSPARAGLRGPAAALAPGSPPAARSASASINCLGTTCTYTVPPHMTITVTLTLDVAPTATSGVLQLSAAGYAPSRATLTVQSAVTSPAGPATTTPATSAPAATSAGAESTSPAEQTTDDESGADPTTG